MEVTDWPSSGSSDSVVSQISQIPYCEVVLVLLTVSISKHVILLKHQIFPTPIWQGRTIHKGSFKGLLCFWETKVISTLKNQNFDPTLSCHHSQSLWTTHHTVWSPHWSRPDCSWPYRCTCRGPPWSRSWSAASSKCCSRKGSPLIPRLGTCPVCKIFVLLFRIVPALALLRLRDSE